MDKFRKIVLNIPHSSLNGIAEARWNNWPSMTEKFMDWTDLYTDVLFAPDPAKFDIESQFDIHVFPYNRFFIDAERLIDDPLETAGQGIIYTDFEGHHRELTPEEKARLERIYVRFIAGFSKSLFASSHDTLLIDCHSFPSRLAPDVDFCIGFNDNWSRPSESLISVIKNILESNGYKVGVNTPYSNSLTPVTAFYKSLMIEVNKRLYLDETTHTMTPQSTELTAMINQLYDFCLTMES